MKAQETSLRWPNMSKTRTTLVSLVLSAVDGYRVGFSTLSPTLRTEYNLNPSKGLRCNIRVADIKRRHRRCIEAFLARPPDICPGVMIGTDIRASSRALKTT